MNLCEATVFSMSESRQPVSTPTTSGTANANRNWLRAGIGLLLLALLFTWVDFSSMVGTMLQTDSTFVIAAIACFCAQFAVAMARWVYILRRQNLDVGWRDALAIYGVGTLANLFLVTSVAGLSVRAVMLVRSGSGVVGALASLSVERIGALAGLVICVVAGMPFAYDYLGNQLAIDFQSHFGSLALCLAIAAVAVGIVLMSRFAAIREFVSRIWSAFSSPRTMVLLTTMSAVVILLGFAGMAMLAHGMGIDIHPVFFLSVMPIVAFVSGMPISIGGWGVREGMVVAGLSIFAVAPEPALAVSVSYGLAGTVRIRDPWRLGGSYGGCLAENYQ